MTTPCNEYGDETHCAACDKVGHCLGPIRGGADDAPAKPAAAEPAEVWLWKTAGVTAWVDKDAAALGLAVRRLAESEASDG